SVRRVATERESGFFESVTIRVVEFVTMTMPFVNKERPIKLARLRARSEMTHLRTETHRAAFLDHLFLVVEHRNYPVRRAGIEFGRMRLFEMEYVARKFDRGDLHAQAQAEVRNFLLARIFGRGDFALDAAFAKATRDENAAEPLQNFVHSDA